MNRFYNSLRRIFQRESGVRDGALNEQELRIRSGSGSELFIGGDSLISLLQLIEHTRENQYTCEETLDLLDEYAELTDRKEDMAAIMPLVKGHVDHCPDCTERYEALLAILELED